MPGARTLSEYVLVGRDPASACLGGGRENSQTLRVSPLPHPFSSYTPKEAPLEGRVLHSRCWDLIELRVGTQAASRLDLVVAALERQWWEDIIPRICHGETQFAAFYTFSRSQEINRSDKQHDPIRIPEVDTLLDDCTRLSASRESQSSSLKSGRTFKVAIPLEIHYLVAEYLNLADTYNMLLAFGVRFPVTGSDIVQEVSFSNLKMWTTRPSLGPMLPFKSRRETSSKRKNLMACGVGDGS